jgi:hypothetical protein
LTFLSNQERAYEVLVTLYGDSIHAEKPDLSANHKDESALLLTLLGKLQAGDEELDRLEDEIDEVLGDLKALRSIHSALTGTPVEDGVDDDVDEEDDEEDNEEDGDEDVSSALAGFICGIPASFVVLFLVFVMISPHSGPTLATRTLCYVVDFVYAAVLSPLVSFVYVAVLSPLVSFNVAWDRRK